MSISNPQIEVGLEGNGTYFIQARLWNPQKEFYCHPTLFNLSKEEALYYMAQVTDQNITIKEIVSNWDLIGS